jgi:hypothetical protein
MKILVYHTGSVGDAVTHVKVGSSLEDTDDNIPLRFAKRKILFHHFLEIGKRHFIYGSVKLRVIVVGGHLQFSVICVKSVEKVL